MDAAPDDRTGSLLAGRYDLGPLAGTGGTADVYRAWDHGDGCAVAVKVFRRGAAPAPGYGGGRELEALTGVRHPGLVALRGAGIDGQGSPFVVMDLVDGDSLAARLHDGPLPSATVVRAGVVLADALAAVHARGIVHRDVKPANVLVDADDRPWLTDFGIARVVDATRVTATGLVVGTAAYMAPEQVRGEAVGPAADVYALGLVLLEAATGNREYDGGAIESALARLHRSPQVPAELPDPLAGAVRAMTVLDPAARPTAAQVAAALRAAPGAVRRPTVARRVGPVAALACLVAGALVGGVALVGDRGSAEPAAGSAGVAAPLVPVSVPVADLPVPPPAAAAEAAPVALEIPAQVGTPAERSAGARDGTGERPAPPARRSDDRVDDRSDRADDRGDDRPDAPRKTAPKAPSKDGPEDGPKRDADDHGDKDKGKGSGKGSGKSDDGKPGKGDGGKGDRSGSNSGKG